MPWANTRFAPTPAQNQMKIVTNSQQPVLMPYAYFHLNPRSLVLSKLPVFQTNVPGLILRNGDRLGLRGPGINRRQVQSPG
jgi:hypothetical protein